MAQSEQKNRKTVTINSQKYLIRNLKFCDSAALHKIDTLCFPPERSFTEGYFLLLFFHENAYGWALEVDDNIIGFILLTSKQNRTNIASIDVHPDFQRQGVGFALMEMAEEDARNARMKSITLQVETTNETAIRLYHKFGFTKTKKLHNYYAGADAWLMSKKLN